MIGESDGQTAETRFPSHYRELLSETRPLPPGATDAEALQYIPTAQGEGPDLGRTFTAREIYQVIWKLRARDPFERCGPHCKECDIYAGAHTDWRNGRGPRPPQLPILRSSRSPGPDGVPAELLLFSRAPSGLSTEEFRERMATDLAGRLNAILSEGRASTTVMQCRTTPVPKGDGSDPHVNSFRGVTVSGLLSKILSLALTRRTVHWALHHGLIDDAQAGFLPRRSSEQHVWVLMELLRSRFRHNSSTCLLFIDLKKAYDKTHLAALWEILNIMGAPPTYIRLLSGIAAQRSTSVHVNGFASQPFPVSAGVPQGDPLSCILFILFIEPLSRQLALLPQAGVSLSPEGNMAYSLNANSLIIRRLFYADDFVIPFYNPWSAQAIIDTVNQWCTWWGATIGTGPGNTELMHFAAPSPQPARRPRPPRSDAAAPHPIGGAPPEWLPPVYVNDAHVPWVPRYRYLGFIVQNDLLYTLQLSKITATMRTGFYDEISRSPIMRKYAPLGVRLQRILQCTVNAANYARTVLPLIEADRKSLDTILLQLARALLSYPESTSSTLLWATSRFLPSAATDARERERFLLELLYTPTPGLASAVLFDLLREPHSLWSTGGATSNWAHATIYQRGKHIAEGAITTPPASYYDIPTAAHCYARTVAATIITGAADAARQPPPAAPPTLSSAGSGKHAVALTGDWSALRAPASLGTGYGHTPINIMGPGCSGALVALSMYGTYPAVTSALLGTEAVERWPFALKRTTSSYGARFTARVCPCCHSATATLSLAHVVNDCTAGLIALWRADFDGHLQGLLSAISTVGAWILGERPPTVDLVAADTAFARYRVLLAVPWASSRAPHDAPACRALGALFDRLNVPHHRLRRWVENWLSSSERQLHALASAWRASYLEPSPEFFGLPSS